MKPNYYDYFITFDKTNANGLMIYHINKPNMIHNMMALPPIKEGCDLIDYSDAIKEAYSGYIHDYDGLVLFTTEKERKLYHKGKLIAETTRKS